MGARATNTNTSSAASRSADGHDTHDTRARYRPGMAMRMGIGFAALAITIFAANLITQQGTREARERMHQLVMQHEPLVRATEALANAVVAYERTLLGYTDGAITLEQVGVVSERLDAAAAAYVRVAPRVDEEPSAHLEAGLRAYRAAGEELVALNTVRRARAREYWTSFRQYHARLRIQQEHPPRFAAAAAAGEALLAAVRALESLRGTVGTAITELDPSQREAVEAGEAAFLTLLDAHAATLATWQGEAWLEGMRADFVRLVGLRRSMFSAIDAVGRKVAAFRTQGTEMSSHVLTQLVEPARRALAHADSVAVHAAARADRQLAWASVAVLALLLLISIATVTSVTLPVRRLTEATRKLASGAVRTRVPRGGVRELDVLAAAFNRMAEELEQAQLAVRSHQALLESKVEERTRELQHLADHDPLTQLPNRRQLFAYLDAALKRARSSGKRVALLFLDLDNFKTVNDSLGHDFGDQVLKAVSRRLRESAALERAFSARLGGDEFTVVCESIESLAEVERLSAAVLEEFQPSLSIYGRELRLSVSVGACIYPDHGSDPQGLLRAADAALFRAKELGRNRGSLFAPELLEAASSRFRLEQALRRAVARGEFDLVYQPQACFETLGTHGVEALLRWHQPDGQIVAPGDFMAAAEQSGLIVEISDWVLHTALQAAAGWHRGAWPAARVAVNVSSQQLMNGDFVQRLNASLMRLRLPPECLELELTETVLQTGPATISALHELRELGVSIALDDFGTGYSSLTSLEQLPLTRVKIDRSLIANVDTGERSPAILRSIIGLCHSLGLRVTAEGVERTSQLGMLLQDRGVQVQGFLVSAPINAAEVPRFVAASRARLEELLVASAPVAPASGPQVRPLRRVRRERS